MAGRRVFGKNAPIWNPTVLSTGLPFSALLQFQWLTHANEEELGRILWISPMELQKSRIKQRISSDVADRLFDAMLLFQTVKPNIIRAKKENEDLISYLYTNVTEKPGIRPIQLLGSSAGLSFLWNERTNPQTTASNRDKKRNPNLASLQKAEIGIVEACKMLEIQYTNILELDESIRKGFPISALTSFINRSGFDKPTVIRILIFPGKDPSWYQKKDCLSPAISNRLFRMALTYLVIQNEKSNKTLDWFTAQNPGLQGLSPIDLLATSAGNFHLRNLLSKHSSRMLQTLFRRLLIREPRSKSLDTIIYKANRMVNCAERRFNTGKQIKNQSRELLAQSILPCPICGAKGDIYYETGMELTRVICCVKCGHFGRSAWDNIFQAIRNWNEDR